MGIPLASISNKHARAMHRYVLKQVLEAATVPPCDDAAQCTNKDKQATWVCCEACGRWCHMGCVNVTEACRWFYLPNVSQLLWVIVVVKAWEPTLTVQCYNLCFTSFCFTLYIYCNSFYLCYIFTTGAGVHVSVQLLVLCISPYSAIHTSFDVPMYSLHLYSDTTQLRLLWIIHMIMPMFYYLFIFNKCTSVTC